MQSRREFIGKTSIALTGMGLALSLKAQGADASAAEKRPVVVSGRVFVERAGAASREMLAGVVVSDGVGAVVTSRDGKYQIETEAGRLLWVSLPRGYRSNRFYEQVKAEAAAQVIDFPLSEWPESRSEPMRLVHITDLHIAGEDTADTFIEDIEEINGLYPKAGLVIATGDLVNVGHVQSQYDNYVRSIPRFEPPYFNVPGNHDSDGKDRTLHNYRKHLGPEYYSFNAGGCHVVVLNCLKLDEVQKKWLEADLKAAPRRASRVFALHFLPTQEQLNYMQKLGGVAVLSGHWHGNRVRRQEGIMDLNTPPLRFGGIDRHPRGFRVVDIKNGHVTSELRLGGFKRHAVVAAPAGACVTKGNKVQVVVNAYDTRCDVASVECEVGDRRVLLKRKSPWSWIGEIKIPAHSPDPQHLTATIRDLRGETWTAQSTFWKAESAEPAAQRSALRLAWAAPTGGFAGVASPVITSKAVVIGVDDRGDLKRCGISAFRKDGRLLWHRPTDSAIKNNVCAANGRIYATSVAGWLYAIKESSGRIVWKTELDRARERWEISATTVADGVVYVGAASYVAAYDARTGKRLWEITQGQSDWWPSCYVIPIVSHGLLILPSRIGAFAFDAKTGEKKWGTSGAFHGCALGEKCFYTVRKHALTALKIEDGQVLWSDKEEIGDTASSPVLAGDKLVVGTADGRVCAHSSANGALLWSFNTNESLTRLQPYARGGRDVNSSPVVHGETVYVGASDGKLYALSLATGELLGSYALGAPIASSPVIDGDRLLVASYDGNVYAFAI